MRVLVTTPYGVDSLQGNTVSAKRIASLLNEEGLDAEVVSDGDDFSNIFPEAVTFVVGVWR